MKQKNSVMGFTLLELVIAIVILAILAAIAIPNYQRYVTHSWLERGKSALAENAMAMERFYAKNRSYKNGSRNLTIDDLPHKEIPVGRSGDQRGYSYALAVTNNGSAYTMTATPKGSQASASGGGKECGTLQVDQSGTYSIKLEGKNDFTTDTADCFK